MKTYRATKLIPAPEQSRTGKICNDARILDPALVARPETIPIPDFGVHIFESRHSPGFSPSILNQDFSEFLLVIDGRAKLEAAGKFELFHLDFVPCVERLLFAVDFVLK